MEGATPYEFWFLVAAGVTVRLDDVVVARTRKPDGSEVAFYGMVDEVVKKHEGVTFQSDVEDVKAGLLPVNTAYSAHVRVIRLDPEEFIPIQPGDTVSFAQGDDFKKALYQDKQEVPRVPAGLLPNGGILELNFEFLDGSSGAHVNISGVSGVATKTSYALFLLYSIFNSQALGTRRANAKALIFNVKGEDLMFLDLPNAKLDEKEAAAKFDRYEALGLPKRPFQDVQLLAPPLSEGGTLVPATGQRNDGVTPFAWTVRDFCAKRLLPFCFADRDASVNLGFIIGSIEDKLYRLALSGKETPYLTVSDWNADEEDTLDLDIQFDDMGKKRITGFRELVAYLEYKLTVENDGAGDRRWVGSHTSGTVQAFIRRLKGVQKHLAKLVRGDLSQRQADASFPNPMRRGVQLSVVDIHDLSAHAQMFVVGALLRDLFEYKEKTGDRSPVFIVLDELNKYAPRDGESPIKDVLLDIAERGRSLGIILIGAQQTASEVERRITSNAAIRVVGRLDVAEAERPEYRFLPQSFRLRAGILQPGTMLVTQPELPSPVLVKFPFPAYATRKDEVKTAVKDEDVEAVGATLLGL
ncbi:ATP-binding protein [Deinococcus yavapaiensis]|nr:ATP-binding protein [Deinococcus yavapaiensis]